MMDQRCWVFWRYEQEPGRAKPSKVPFSPKDGRRVSLHDGGRLTDFTTAMDARTAFGGAGVGVILPAGVAAVDLDDAVHNGQLTPWAAKTVAMLPSYTELSPSGAGLHIIVRCRAAIPVATKHHVPAGGAVEIFGTPHFLTWTGRRWPGAPDAIADATSTIMLLLDRIAAKRQMKHTAAPSPTPVDSIPADDANLLRIAYASAKGRAIQRLMDGDAGAYGDDESRADFALASHLAFWTGKDPDRVKRIMQASGLRRAKWEEPHTHDGESYLSLTVRKACDTCRTVFGQGGKSTGVGR